MNTALRRPLLVSALGLVLAAVLLIGCSGGDEETPTPAVTAAATQVVGTAATAVATTATTATPATPAATTELVWPERQANIPIYGAITDAPARVTPTPLPAGAPTPTPRPAVPQEPPLKQEIIFYVDTTTAGAGESPYNVDANLSCFVTKAFARGMHIVWRMIAFDNTGTEIQGDTAESMVLKVPGGEEKNFRYGRHGTTWFWTATWDVPLDFPLGTLDWSVEAVTKSGLKGTYTEIPVFTAPGSERLLVDGTKTRSDSRTMIVY